jgi:hypothetical protein
LYPIECQRLSIGGTSIESGAINLVAWSGFMGLPARRGQITRLPTVDRGFQFDRPPWDTRLVTLGVYATDRDADLLITDPNGRVGQLEANIDTLLGLFAGTESQGLVTLDRLMADGSTRFIQFRVTSAAAMAPGPFFGATRAAYQIAVQGECPHPFWQTDDENSDGISGFTYPATYTAPLVNPVFTFTGAGDAVNPGNGDSIEVDGACVVDLRNRRITSGGSPADNLVTANRAHLMRIMPGDTLTHTGASATIAWRGQWL